MSFNKLLQKQIDKILPASLQGDTAVRKLLAAVNDSYNAYERDNDLVERAFRISEEEYIEINKKLAREVEVRKQSVEKLKETIGVITGKTTKNNSEDLLVIARYLSQQVHKRKKAEQELKASQEIWQFALEGAGDGVWEYDFETNEVFFSKQYKKMLGYEDDEFKNETHEWSDRIHPDDLHIVEETDKLYFDNKIKSHDREYRIKHKNGTYLWILDRGMLINHDASDKPKRIIGTHTNITERKKAEEEYKRISVVASANKNGVVFTNTSGNIIWSNEGFCTLTGYSMNEVIGQTPLDLCMGELSKSAELSEMVKSFYEGLNFDTEVIFYRKDGSTFWGRAKGQAVLDESGKTKKYFAIIEDISEEKKQAEQLHILSSLAEENTNGVVIAGRDGKVEWVNKSFEKITGFTLGEMKGKRPGQVLQGPGTNPETVAYLKKQIALGEPFVCEIQNYNKAGNPYWLRIQGQALKDKQGNVLKYFAIEEDITHEKETQQKLNEFESHFRLALEKLGDNVWEHDFITGTTVFSNTGNNFLGFGINEFTDNQKLWWDSVYKEDIHLLVENDRKYTNNEIDFHVLEYRMMHRNGSIKWVLDRGVVLEKDRDGKPLKIIGTHADVTKQKDAEEALKFKEEKYRNIIANINLGLLEVDTEENIQYANYSFCKMSGYGANELKGKNASALFVKPECRGLVSQKNESRRQSNADAYEISAYNKKGEERWWLISGAPNYNDRGELIGSIGIHLDITEQKKLELELIQAKNSAEASTLAKEMFLANMSHEIRTPMNAIMGMANQMGKTALDKDQQFYLGTILSAADNLLIIINDILDLSKIEAGKLTLEHIGFEPKAILSRVRQVMMHKTEEKGLTFTKSFCDSRLWPVLKGDPYRLNQILLNLISNAIKFTEKGSVDISCRVIEETDTHQTLQTSVTDTGIGMEEKFVKNLFQKFSQEDASVTRQYGGTGLGMSICKQLVELMNGKIYVESTKGKGTTITIEVVFEKGSVCNLPQKESYKINPDILAGKRILVADDNKMNRLVASAMLKNYGAEIIHAANGEEAVQKIKEESFDLVFMDVQMPVMDGLEATRLIRATINKDLPIIALTALAIKGDNIKCTAAGMNDYLSKPFQEVQLVNIASKWLGMQDIPVATEIKETAQPEEKALYDLSKMSQLTNGDPSFLNEIISIFIDQAVVSVQEIKTAYINGDMHKIKAVAHKIKPSIDNMGIESLRDKIRDIETNAELLYEENKLEAMVAQVENVLTEVVRMLD